MRNRLQRLGIALFVITGASQAIAAEDGVKDTRKHYAITVAGGGGAALGIATRVSRVASTWDRYYVLFQSETGDELVIEAGFDYAAKTSEMTIRNVKGDAWVAARYKLPFSGKTRAEALAEGQQNPGIYALIPDELEIETNAWSWKGTQTEWLGPARLQLTKQFRRGIAFDLLETIERTVESGFSIEGITSVKETLVGHLLYRPNCEQRPPLATLAIPDCDFDERFGFPCSKKQLVRAKDAKELGVAPEQY